MYKYAEIRYGKIVAINKHEAPLEEYKKFFSANSLILDITNIKINGEDPQVNDVVMIENNGYKIIHPQTMFSVEETKAKQIEILKIMRNKLELEPINYNGVLFDADKDALMRLDKARQLFTDNPQLTNINWSTADNKVVSINLEDFKNINTAISSRSNMLHNRYNELKEYINNMDERYLKIILKIDWNWDT